jgi:HAD superfamily hydrolase (TIGR01509 family)
MAAPDIKALIFDCFGVLYLDTNQSLLSVVPPEHRQELADLYLSNNYGYFSRKEYVAQIAELCQLSTDDIEEYISREHHPNMALIELIRDTLKQNYKIGLLSNIGAEWIEDFFTKHDLHNLFDEVILSGEVGMAKPHPGIYELAASRLCVAPEECLMIDDIQANCVGAEDTGMQAVQFISNPQLQDYFYERKLL